MRIVPKEALLEAIPARRRRVGLVGAAVSDHPKIVEIVRALAERGCEVGLSQPAPRPAERRVRRRADARRAIAR